MVLENPIRRKIICRLSEEPSYPLELSGEIGAQQQLVTKHLKVMEEADVVETTMASSPRGPDRRVYSLTKSISLIIDFSPDLYGARMFSIEDFAPSSKYEKAGEFEERLDRLSGRRVSRGEITSFTKLISDIDQRVGELERERATLLYLRSLAMRAAKESLRGKDLSLRDRIIAYHLMNRSERTARESSEGLI